VKIDGNKSKYLLLVALILLGVVLVYGAHYIDYSKCDGCISGLYPYPIHGDEWTHLAQGISFMEKGTLSNTNPYIVMGVANDLELGFHAFIAQFFTLTGLNPILNQRFLPASFIILYILSIVIFVHLVTKNFYIGLLAGLFFLSIRGNINIYGLWFFVPIIFSIFLIFMFFYTYLKDGLKFISAIFFLTTIVVYPIATIFITSVLTLYLMYNKKIKFVHVCYLSALAMLSILLIGFNKLEEYFIFMTGWTSGFEVEYSLFQIYGIIGILSAMLGIYFVFKKKYNKILLIALILPIFSIICYSFFKATLLIPYQRALIYMMISLVPLSAIGVYHALELIYSGIKNNFVSIGIISLLILFLSVGLFYNYYIIPDHRFVPQHIVSDADYNALLWVKDNIGTNYTIIVPGLLAFSVYPISHDTVFAVPGSSLRSRNITIVDSFYAASDCAVKESLLSTYPKNKSLGHTKIVYSTYPIACDFLNNVYSRDGVYIYTIR